MDQADRELISGLFSRMKTVDLRGKDTEAEAFIHGEMRQNGDSPYLLVQTVLAQEEALRLADERIRTLETENESLKNGGAASKPARPTASAGFTGAGKPVAEPAAWETPAAAWQAPRPQTGSGSVPRTGGAPGAGAGWGAVPASSPNGHKPAAASAAPGLDAEKPSSPPPYRGMSDRPSIPPAQDRAAGGSAGGGGGFLRQAMATAAGAAGGMLIANSLSGLFGGGSAAASPATASAPAATPPATAAASPPAEGAQAASADQASSANDASAQTQPDAQQASYEDNSWEDDGDDWGGDDGWGGDMEL